MFGPGLLSTNARRFVAATALLLTMSGAFWILSGEDEAAGQGQTTTASSPPTTTASPSAASPNPSSPSAASPSALDDFGSFLDASASPLAEEEEEPEGIPGLGAVDLLSGVEELTPGTEWACDGPGAGDGDLYEWRCVDPSGAYSVDATGPDSLSVLSVTAVARGVSDAQAEEFFGYVLELCLQGSPASLSTEAWVSGNVPSGGSTFSGDVGVAIYGTREARALEVTASDVALD